MGPPKQNIVAPIILQNLNNSIRIPLWMAFPSCDSQQALLYVVRRWCSSSFGVIASMNASVSKECGKPMNVCTWGEFWFLVPISETPLEAEFWFRFRLRIFWSEFIFRIPLLKSHQIGITILKFRIPEFCSCRNSVHLILYQKTIAISFPTKITSTGSTCKMSRCHFGGQNNHAAKLISTQNE
jgi:hypothetical protein